MKTLMTVMLILTLTNCTTAPAPERAILDRWAVAIGGRDALARVDSTWRRAEYEGPEGRGTIEWWNTSNGARRQVEIIVGREVVTVFDGTRGWTTAGSRVRELNESEIASERTSALLGSFALLGAASRVRDRVDVKYVGVEGKHDVVRIGRSTMYLDHETALPVRYVAGDLTMEYDGWTMIDGVRFPQRVHLSANGGGYRATETLLDAKINAPIDAALFTRPPEPPRDFRLTAGTATIPFEEEDGHLFIRASINGSKPVIIGVDTGAAATVIDTSFAAELGLTGPRGAIGGAGGAAESMTIRGVDIAIPGAEINDLTVDAADIGFIGARTGRNLSAILGYELFSRFVVELDYSTHEMRLYDSDAYTDSPGSIIPIEIEGNHPYVRASVHIGGETISGRFIIDLGSNNSVIIAPGVVNERKLLAKMPRTLKSRGSGVGGEIEMHLGRAESIALGPFVIEAPLAILPNGGEFASTNAVGNLGAPLLRRFRTVFDYARLRMIVEPTSLFGERDESDMAGAAFELDPTNQQVRVARVRPNAPAFEAGLLPKDELITVDGIPAVQLGLPALRGRFRIPDREYRLRIRRDSAEQELTLRTRRLI